MVSLSGAASKRLQAAFRPKTAQCYALLFRTFVAFSIIMKVSLYDISTQLVVCFLEYLASQGTSVHMVANYISALRAKLVIYQLNYAVVDHPQIRYFIKAMKINRPLSVPRRNVMSISDLKVLIGKCKDISMGLVYKAVFLVAYFGMLRLSNMAPHSAQSFDHSRHLCGGDVVFTSKYVKILIKWTKTVQTRDKIHVLSLPKLATPLLCPYSALKDIFAAYNPLPDDPLFQIKTAKGMQVLIDSRIRKVLSSINLRMGYPPNFFTFHTFRCSGATLAYNSHVPIHQIQHHGSWTSDCVWRYIKQDQKLGEDIANTFATVVNNA